MGRLSVKIGMVILILAGMLGLTVITTTAFGWALPGSFLFPLQERLEQVTIIGSSSRRVERTLNLVERRIEDLLKRAGTSHELAALEALGSSIDLTTHEIANTSDKLNTDVLNRLVELLLQADAALNTLTELPRTDGDLLVNVQTRLKQLVYSLGEGKLIDVYEGHQSSLITQTGKPPDDASPVKAFFALTGSHAGLECLACHITGQFANTNSTCIGCHVDVTPAGNAHHFHTACDNCHTANSWQEIIWDHTPNVAEDCYLCHEWDVPSGHSSGQCSLCHGITSWLDGTSYHTEPSNCWTCHIEEAPYNHYTWQCSKCHTTTSWSDAEYHPIIETLPSNNVQSSHVDARCAQCHGDKQCSSCHEIMRPANHFAGQCSYCHVTDGWRQVTFLHSPDADCRSCHTATAPQDHYSGQCYDCHTFDGWTNPVFNHSGFTDCISCHASTAPDNHYPGQCSNCHHYTGWEDVRFSHIDLTDCIGCHASTAPPNHYSGQCSLCHNPSGWANVSFNHSGQTDCRSCHADDAPPDHFLAQCSDCHTPTTWGAVTFNHEGYTDCIGCHANDAPPDHYDLQCSECHTPTTWGEVDFNHVGYTDCISCHEDDRPDDHPQAQCSVCHNTNSWEDVNNSEIWMENSELLESTLNISCGACHLRL